MTAVIVRRMQPYDVASARLIFQRAFGTSAGVADPDNHRADNGMVPSRFLRDPGGALVAEDAGRILGSNFVTTWGSHGFFGPLTVDPGHWNRGVAAQLLEATMPIFRARAIRSPALYTLSNSPKHVELYRRHGFWPRFLTAITIRKTERRDDTPGCISFSRLSETARETALGRAREICDTFHPGLDPTEEIRATVAQRIGDTLMLDDAFAVLHIGEGSEAGSNRAYVKFAAAIDRKALSAILLAAINHAAATGMAEVEAGTNLGRPETYEVLTGLGFQPRMFGVAMHFGNDPLYNRTGVMILDDWR